MNRRSSRIIKILLSLFLLNSLSLLIYYLSHSSKQSFNPTNNYPNSLRKPHNHQTITNHRYYSTTKPWPILPSYLPWWTQQTAPPKPRSCEAFFGNGFTRRFDLVKPPSPGWFACRFSETLGSSVCEGGGVRMVSERVRMARGGERLEDVIGRSEDDELPEFADGAFEVDGGDLVRERKRVVELGDDKGLDEFMPSGEVLRHTMRGLLRSAFVVPSKEFVCDEWIEEPTILVTRFEYANLFHTVTDWYSAYVASRVTGLPNRPHLIFVDGHCRAPLEDTWRALFSSLRYAKNFTGSVCFRHVVLVPLGYETPLFKGLNEEIDCEGTSAQDLWRNPNDRKTARLSEFGEMIRAAFGFSVNRPRAEKPDSGFNILFVRREDYLAHPRHKGKVESRLTNEEEVFNAVKAWALVQNGCRVNLVNGLFGHISMKEQVRAIQSAHVIIGAHGAGLTHIVSALPKTVVLEIISSLFRRPHFQLIARWKGLEYHAINLPGSVADPPEVVEKLSSIMRGLGCSNTTRKNENEAKTKTNTTWF